MAILSIYIPDSGANRVFDAIAANYRYQETVRNPVGGQNIVLWASSPEDNITLLPIASGQGYVGDLPGTEISEGEFVPVVSPFVGNYGSSGILGVVTGVHPQIIPNPETKAMFTNGIIRGFLADHTKVYELDLARKAAEAVANGTTAVTVDDGATATVYDYHMVCLEPAKSQYDGLASIISPGNSFNIPLSTNGTAPATHYGLEVGITETARQQLLVLELAGGTTTNGVQTMFYVRCDPQTHIAQATNISGFDIIGKSCSFSGLLNHLELQIIEPSGQ